MGQETSDATRTINLPLYLQVLGRVPEINQADISAARLAFINAYGGTMPATVTFDRGLRKGDGHIIIAQELRGYDGQTRHTSLHLREDGMLANPDAGFSAQLPTGIFAMSFFGGIFGRDEFSSSFRGGNVDVIAIAAGRWGDKPPSFKKITSPVTSTPSTPRPFVVRRHRFGQLPIASVTPPTQSPTPEGKFYSIPDITHYSDEIIEGVRLLYTCAEKNGSVAACQNSDGMQILSAINARITNEWLAQQTAEQVEADRIAKEAKEEAERVAREAKEEAERVAREAAEASRRATEQKIDELLNTANAFWQKAGRLIELSKEQDAGPGGINPRDLERTLASHRDRRITWRPQTIAEAEADLILAKEMFTAMVKQYSGYKTILERSGDAELGCTAYKEKDHHICWEYAKVTCSNPTFYSSATLSEGPCPPKPAPKEYREPIDKR